MENYIYRVWDNNNNKWLFAYDIFGGFSLLGEVVLFGQFEKIISHYSITDFKDIIITQYTGLKDKNGKEIYEGDIIKFKRKSLSKNNEIRVVKFYHAAFLLYRKNSFVSFLLLHSDLMEVIGNIFENKDLSNSL